MAPEQITGDPVDHRADQFAIGVVFYELLAYAEAFPGDTLPMITHKILTEEPVPLERLAPEVSPDIIAIVVKALKKTAAERYDDSEALRVAISRVRKEFSSNAAWNARTILASRDTPPAGVGTRGTGSARRREDDAVGVAQMTPPPDPKRTDREAIARRRLVQIEVSLQQARDLLAEGHLEAALDACQQALTFDEAHAGALDLEAEINVAIELREHAARASAATAAAPFDGSPSPADAVTRLDEPPPSRSSGAGDRTVLRVPGAPRRTPAPLPPPPVAPAALQPVTELPSARTPMAPVAKAPTPPARKTATQRPDLTKQIASLKARLSYGLLPVEKALRDKRTVVWVGAGAALVLVAAVIGGLMMFGSPQTGSVTIDAVPWGTVTSIESASGAAQPLPADAATPLVLTLPAGDYRVTLAGPSLESQTQQVAIRVEAGVQVAVPIVRFHVLTPEEYFEEYLAAPAATGDSTAAPVASAPPPASNP
jgi:hypothetical protein